MQNNRININLIEEKENLIQAAYPNWNGKLFKIRQVANIYNSLCKIERQLEANGWLSIYKHINTAADLAANNGVAIYKHTNTTKCPGTSYDWKEGLVIQLTPRSRNWVNYEYKRVRAALCDWCTADLNIGIDKANYRIQVAITAYPYTNYLHHLMGIHQQILNAGEDVIFNQEFIKQRQREELEALEQILGANPEALFLILGF
jgi:hypothetical protein